MSVLAVEDERIVARDLKNRLVELGYNVLPQATSAEEALELAEVHVPSVVLMDIRLAGAQDGIDAAHVFRERFDVPVVFCTAHSDDETLARAGQSQPYGYLVKPYGDRELKAALDIAIFKHGSEKQLRETNERLHLSQKVAQLGIWVKDLKARLYEVSEEARQILGLQDKPEIAQANPFALVDPDDRVAIESAIERCLEAGEPMQVEFQRHFGQGSTRFVRQYGEVVADRSGKTRRLLAVVQDVTQYKLLEEKLRRSQKLEAIGQLAGGVAHDFNNLLVVIQGYCDMVLQEFEPGHPIHWRVLEIKKAADRAAALTRQLLAFSGRQLLRPRAINLNQVITDFESMLRRLIAESVEIRKRLAADVWPVVADTDQIEQVIMNLVLNARDAIPQRGVITISTANVELTGERILDLSGLTPGRYVCFSVTDTGTGIPAEIKPRLFEPFFTTKEPSKGTGLGLSTVYGIVKQHKGDVSVHSEFGYGTIIHVYLPATEAAAEPAEAAKPVSPPRQATETILVVEDELAVRDLVADILRTKGYQVLLASSGQEALRVAESTTAEIHVVLTDMVMPGMTGLELSQRISSMQKGIRVVLMSGYAGASAVSDSLPTDLLILSKPFNQVELERVIEQALEWP